MSLIYCLCGWKTKITTFFETPCMYSWIDWVWDSDEKFGCNSLIIIKIMYPQSQSFIVRHVWNVECSAASLCHVSCGSIRWDHSLPPVLCFVPSQPNCDCYWQASQQTKQTFIGTFFTKNHENKVKKHKWHWNVKLLAPAPMYPCSSDLYLSPVPVHMLSAQSYIAIRGTCWLSWYQSVHLTTVDSEANIE